jgi:hypothetical protein
MECDAELQLTTVLRSIIDILCQYQVTVKDSACSSRYHTCYDLHESKCIPDRNMEGGCIDRGRNALYILFS